MRYDVIIIGAGASGLMCAIRAGERGLSVLVIEKSASAGQKILISGGGRCNFTNLDISPDAFISPNPHFCKSALSRYTQWHFLELFERYQLTYNEKTLGQLFCDQKSKAVVEMLVDEAKLNGVKFAFEQDIQNITQDIKEFQDTETNIKNNTKDNTSIYKVATLNKTFSTSKIVIACGGASFPKLGASDFALRLAKQFKLKNTPFVPALVPLMVPEGLVATFKTLAGVSLPVIASCNDKQFRENLLFTHRGLSGPAILQISSYWHKGDTLSIDLCPDTNLHDALTVMRAEHPKRNLSKALAQFVPKQLAQSLVEWTTEDRELKQFSDKQLAEVATFCHNWQVQPNGSEGMKKAEVCTGGIHPDMLSSKTFEAKTQKGLYVIGEAVDVTGWLGGYNFQWAWSSGWCCGDSL